MKRFEYFWLKLSKFWLKIIKLKIYIRKYILDLV